MKKTKKSKILGHQKRRMLSEKKAASRRKEALPRIRKSREEARKLANLRKKVSNPHTPIRLKLAKDFLDKEFRVGDPEVEKAEHEYYSDERLDELSQNALGIPFKEIGDDAEKWEEFIGKSCKWLWENRVALLFRQTGRTTTDAERYLANFSIHWLLIVASEKSEGLRKFLDDLREKGGSIAPMLMKHCNYHTTF